MTRRSLLVHLWLQTALWIAIAAVSAHLGAAVYARVDVTRDQRFSLSESAIRAVSSLDRPLIARAFFTRDLDPPYHTHETALRDLLTELRAASGGRLEVAFVDPTGDPEAIERARQFGVTPVTYARKDWDRQEARQVFMGVAFVHGERQQAISALPSTERMEYEVVRAIRAVTTEPEDRRTIGWLRGDGEPDLATAAPDNPLGKLRDALARSYDLVPVSLAEGPVPEAVDALLVLGPQLGLPEASQLNLDQFVMRGGAVGWFLSGVQPDFRRMSIREVRHDLHGLVGHYGVQLGRDVLLDRQRNETLVVPVRSGAQVSLARVNHPLALATTRIDRVHGPVRDLKEVVLPFATSLAVLPDLSEREAEVWVESGPASVASRDARSLDPAAMAQPAAGERPGPFPVVVAISGRFPSYFVERQPPGGIDPASLLRESPPTRMVVASSADMVANNPLLVQNAVDWLVEDASLVAIRSRAVGDDPLTAPPADQAWRYRLGIVAPPLLLVWAVGALVAWRSRR